MRPSCSFGREAGTYSKTTFQTPEPTPTPTSTTPRHKYQYQYQSQHYQQQYQPRHQHMTVKHLAHLEERPTDIVKQPFQQYIIASYYIVSEYPKVQDKT